MDKLLEMMACESKCNILYIMVPKDFSVKTIGKMCEYIKKNEATNYFQIKIPLSL